MFHWYGLIVGIAGVVGWSVAERIYLASGGVRREFVRVTRFILIGGFIGARLYHVIDQWEYYSLHLHEIVAAWNGGLAIWGGIVGGLIGYRWVKKFEWDMLAAIAVGLPLAQAIGRVGNYVNREFLEKVWIVQWWLAEGILDLVLACILYFLATQRVVSNKTIVALYLTGYGSIRLVLEWWRIESTQIVGMPVAVIFSGLAISAGWALWRKR